MDNFTFRPDLLVKRGKIVKVPVYSKMWVDEDGKIDGVIERYVEVDEDEIEDEFKIQ